MMAEVINETLSAVDFEDVADIETLTLEINDELVLEEEVCLAEGFSCLL